MPGERHFSRINLLELKAQIASKLGSYKSEKYFNLLNRLFVQKLGKSEFDKLCIATIGRENLVLHNRLIRSILRNACLSTCPPPKASKFDDYSLSRKLANGYQRSCLQSLCRDVFPQSPRRVRTPPGFRDRKPKDRPSPLGPHGKSSTTCEDLARKVLEQQSATELHSLGSRPVEVNSVEDGEEVDQAAQSPGTHFRSPVTAPLGITIHSKGYRKAVNLGQLLSTPMETCYSSGLLPDTSTLRERLEQKLEKEGLKISLDFVNLLNSSLDIYLQRLIKPCLELAGSRAGNNMLNGHLRYKVVPDVNRMESTRDIQRWSQPVSCTMLDFKAAMEIDPSCLGVDWPRHLERVCYNGI